MTSTRPDIRQAMLDQDSTDGLYGTATAGAVGSLTDATSLAVGGNASSRYGSAYLYRPNAANDEDVYRRVAAAGYAPATGVLTHAGPNYTEAPLASGDDGYYELWPFDPMDVNNASNRALTKRCFSLQRDLVVTTGLSRYDVSEAPFSLTDITTIQDQVLEIAQVYGTDPNARVIPWAASGKTWWPELDDGSLYMRFDPPATGTIQITWKKPYAALADEDDETECPVDYVAWATWAELFDSLGKRAVSRGEASTQYDELRTAAFGRYWAENHKHLGRFASMFHYSQPRGRTRTSGPRMGRMGPSLYGPGGRTISGV